MGRMMLNLNARAHLLCETLQRRAGELRVDVHRVEGGGTWIDMGIAARGGLEAGLALAEICLAGLGRVRLEAGRSEVWRGPAVSVQTDFPLAACMASQYAGWQVQVGKFFAMGSGPMRAAAGREALFQRIGHVERPTVAIGVLETRKPPSVEVFDWLAQACQVSRGALALLVAPTASQAGAVQVVARSVETAMHKLYELGFDLSRVESGWGVAPLPPVARDDLAGIGRTNDAILYGSEVTLWVRGDDASLEEIGPRIPSSASADYGEPFAAIFERAGRDFYKIDPHLFSPALVRLANVDTGRSFEYGKLAPPVIARSFES
jgi:methenyltetrahydromethanopterin cyclohydrolase